MFVVSFSLRTCPVAIQLIIATLYHANETYNYIDVIKSELLTENINNDKINHCLNIISQMESTGMHFNVVYMKLNEGLNFANTHNLNNTNWINCFKLTEYRRITFRIELFKTKADFIVTTANYILKQFTYKLILQSQFIEQSLIKCDEIKYA